MLKKLSDKSHIENNLINLIRTSTILFQKSSIILVTHILKRLLCKFNIYHLESRPRKKNYDLEYQKLKNKEDNDAKDIRIQLKRNCSFYLKKAERKLKFLRKEAKDPYMSLHNLGPGFRKSFKNKILFRSFRSFSSFSIQKYK